MAGLEGARLCSGSEKRQKLGGIRKERGKLETMGKIVRALGLG